MLDSYKDDIMTSLEPVDDQLAMTDDAVKQIGVKCEEISDQGASIEASIDKMIEQLREILNVRRTEFVSQLRQLTTNKLKSLATQKDVIEKTHKQLEECKSDIHEKIRLMNDDRELVEMKKTFTAQITELTSAFQPDALKPKSSADIELSVAEDLAVLCRDYGTLSASELLPDPSKCFITKSDMELAMVGTPVTVNVQTIDHFGDPCLPQEDTSSLEFELQSEIIDVKQLHCCRLSESQHTITFTPTVKGQHQLRIKIADQHIRGSPFTVHVKSSVEKLSQISSIKDVARPWGIAISKKGEIIVSENKNHCISVFSPSGTKLRSFGTRGSAEGQFKNPRGIALDGSGNILVADHDNHRIQMFTEDGQFLRALGTKGTAALQFNGPNAIAFNMYNERFYVVDDNMAVRIFDSKFAFCKWFGGRGFHFEEGKFFYEPEVWRGIACDSYGQVYITDADRHLVQVFTAEGVFLKVIGKGTFFTGIFNRPVGIAFDINNLMYVSNRYFHDIVVLTPEDKKMNRVGGRGKGQGQLNFPQGLAVDHCGIIYVCDFENDRISMY